MNRFFKIIKTTGKIILVLTTILVIIYFLGPKPPKPVFDPPVLENFTNQSFTDLEKTIADRENAVENIKPDCKARIVWADSTKKEKTKIVMLYLHGFSASHVEGAPINTDLAKQFGCNIFLARLSEHGVETGAKNENLLKFNAEDYYDSAEEALHIAQQLGDSVLIIGQSGGAAMALFLASRHPELKGLVLYSPAVKVFRKDGQLMSEPWGLQLAHLTVGEFNDWKFRKPEQARYWTDRKSVV